MQIIRIAFARLRALFRRDVIADEIREEMQFHLDERAGELQERGLGSDEAVRAARKKFGNVAVLADRGYDVRGAGLLETVWQDVRYAVRMLRRQRGFAAVTILTLAVAMGASTALFSVIDAALIRPVPYPDADRIVFVTVQTRQADGQLTGGLSPSADDIDTWRTSGDVFAHIGQGRVGESRLIVDAGGPERVRVASISDGYLEVHGVAPLAGRAVTRGDTHAEAPAVVLLGHDFWQRQFAGDPGVIGRSLRVDGAAATIVGVVPGWFYRDTAVWRPMTEVTGDMRAMRGSGTPTYGLLRQGISVEEAEGRLTTLSQPEVNRGGSARNAVSLAPLYDSTIARYRSAVRILAGAVSLVLFIACLNVGGLLLARGATRQGELAVRASMGAGRIRLIRQLLTESLILALGGAVGGVLVAWLTLDGLVAILPLVLPENAPPSINLRVLGFGLALSALATLLCGLWPAIRLSHAQPGQVLARTSRRHGSSLANRSGRTLVAVQVALALCS